MTDLVEHDLLSQIHWEVLRILINSSGSKDNYKGFESLKKRYSKKEIYSATRYLLDFRLIKKTGLGEFQLSLHARNLFIPEEEFFKVLPFERVKSDWVSHDY
jgi:hypothetical protein